MQKFIEYCGKLMSQYTQDKMITGDGYIEFSDRKIEVIDPTRVTVDDKGKWTLSCSVCYASVEKSYIKKVIVDWWNQRADTQTQTKLDAAVEALEFIKDRQDCFYEELTPQYDSYSRGLVTSTLKEINK